MAFYGIIVKKNNPCRTVLYNIQLGAAYNSYSNKVLAILLYKKQLFY